MKEICFSENIKYGLKTKVKIWQGNLKESGSTRRELHKYIKEGKKQDSYKEDMNFYERFRDAVQVRVMPVTHT